MITVDAHGFTFLNINLKLFAIMVNTQFNSKIQTIRSDNDTEFFLKDFFHSNGILHQLACVDTSRQNAIVERKHQHFLNVARALIFQSKVPLCFWEDCVLTAIHLINRIPLKSLGNKSPYKMLFHSPPSYHHLKCFGYLCFVSTLPHNRNKFAPRAKKCVFLSYPYGIKGYKVLNLESNSVYISRDVIFYEHIFPYVTSSQPSTSYLDDFVFPHCTSNYTEPSSPSFPNIPANISTAVPDTTIAISTDPIDITPAISADPIVSTDINS